MQMDSSAVSALIARYLTNSSITRRLSIINDSHLSSRRVWAALTAGALTNSCIAPLLSIIKHSHFSSRRLSSTVATVRAALARAITYSFITLSLSIIKHSSFSLRRQASTAATVWVALHYTTSLHHLRFKIFFETTGLHGGDGLGSKSK